MRQRTERGRIAPDLRRRQAENVRGGAESCAKHLLLDRLRVSATLIAIQRSAAPAVKGGPTGPSAASRAAAPLTGGRSGATRDASTTGISAEFTYDHPRRAAFYRFDTHHRSAPARELEHPAWRAVWAHKQVVRLNVFHSLDRAVEHQDRLARSMTSSRKNEQRSLDAALNG
jgi:hypothetical protein